MGTIGLVTPSSLQVAPRHLQDAFVTGSKAVGSVCSPAGETICQLCRDSTFAHRKGDDAGSEGLTHLPCEFEEASKRQE